MAYGAKVRQQARSLYVYKRLSPEQIASQLKCNKTTVQKWRESARAEGDDWASARAAASLAGDGAQAVALKFLEDFVYLLETTMDDIRKRGGGMKGQERVEALARLADAYNKATVSVQRTLPKVNELGVAMEVMQLLSRFIAEKHPKLQRPFVEVLEPFGQVIARRYG